MRAPHLAAKQAAVALLDTRPGGSQRRAEILLAAMGPECPVSGLLGGPVPRP
jgi:hypothetical protein